MNKINWKQIFQESLYIFAFAIGISVIFNSLNPNGVNLLKKPKVVSDTILEKLLLDTSTSSKLETNNIETTNNIEIKSVPNNQKSDTLLKSNPKEFTEKVEKKESTEETGPEIPTVTINQLMKYLGSPNLILIDARSEEEYSKEHIGNAVNIFAYEQDMNKYFQKLTTIPFDERKVIIVYCEGGTCDASHKVATDLILLGHKNVFVFAGGWEEWTKYKKNKNE